MPLPLAAASLGGMIITSLTYFFATRIPVILATLGLTATVYAGIDIFVDQMVASVQGLVTGGQIHLGDHTIDALGILGAAGLWDSANILLSGYVSVAAVKSAKVLIQAVKK